MGLKYHTVIFVPHARARFRKWRLTNRQLGIAVGVAALLLGGSLFTTWSYFTNRIDQRDLIQVTQDNEELRLVNQTFENSIRNLEKQLAEFEERTRQLAIVAGLDNLAIDEEAGIGGNDESLDLTGDVAQDLPELLQRRAQTLAGEIQTVAGLLDEQQQLISSTPAITPVKGVLTSGFGYRRDPITGRRAWHRGVDISTGRGQPVRAAADGIVVGAGRKGGLGRAVYLSHGYGITTRYGHLSKIEVAPGTRVRRGDTVGFVGSTGRATGYHLHYEVRVDGKAVNPLVYILESTSS